MTFSRTFFAFFFSQDACFHRSPLRGRGLGQGSSPQEQRAHPGKVHRQGQGKLNRTSH